MEGFQRVAGLNEVAPGQSKVVKVNDKAIALFNIDGKFYAIHNLCPHEGGPLNEGRLKGYVVAGLSLARPGLRYSKRAGNRRRRLLHREL